MLMMTRQHASNHQLLSMLIIMPSPLVLIVYVMGLASGIFATLVVQEILAVLPSAASNSHPQSSTTTSSRIWNLAEVSPTSTSHGTSKRQFISPFQVHPSLAGVSMASLQPGERIETHVHPTMHEFMYVVQGRMRVTFETKQSRQQQECATGCLFHGAPNEPHSFRADAETGVQFLVFQLLTMTQEESTARMGSR